MSSNSLTRILFPALLVSSATFAGLTVPLAAITNEPLLIEMSPLFRVEVQPIFVEENKNFAIRYVGGAIVVSVLAGLFTARRIRSKQTKSRSLLEEPLTRLPMGTLEEAMESPQTFNVQEKNEAVSAFQRSAMAADEMNFEMESFAAVDEYFSPAISSSSLLLDRQFEQFASEAEQPIENGSNGTSSSLALVELSTETDQFNSAADDETSFVSQPLESYQTCRIYLPGRSHTVLAIKLEEQYFSLFRTRKTQTEVQRLKSQLSSRNLSTIITQTGEAEYAVWVWQPDAFPEGAA